MKKRIVILFFFFPFLLEAQDLPYAKYLVDTLASPYFEGRGYVNNGDRKAAFFIADEFRKLKTDSLTSGYFQTFRFPVNTFPDDMELAINGKLLIPGADYIVDPACGTIQGTYKIIVVSTPPGSIDPQLIRDKFILIDKSKSSSKETADALNAWKENLMGAKGLVMVEEKKLTWSVAQGQRKYPVIHILQKALPSDPEKIKLQIKAKLIEKYQTQNVICYIRGSVHPDSFVVFSAHYDHLGRMGNKTYFPGANDNASGTAMLLNLVAHYSKPENRPRLSMAFISFAGEEAGLVGSQYYTEKPLFPLEQIKFLVNMDLLGTGDDGMMVVNGSVFKNEFDLLTAINDSMHYVKSVGMRGKAQNSDHYFFSERDVPCFFFYTLGGISAYHDVFDVAATLPFTDFEDVFRLTRDFTDRLMK